MWISGLKYIWVIEFVIFCANVWIEMALMLSRRASVASCVGVWIEITPRRFIRIGTSLIVFCVNVEIERLNDECNECKA